MTDFESAVAEQRHGLATRVAGDRPEVAEAQKASFERAVRNARRHLAQEQMQFVERLSWWQASKLALSAMHPDHGPVVLKEDGTWDTGRRGMATYEHETLQALRSAGALAPKPISSEIGERDGVNTFTILMHHVPGQRLSGFAHTPRSTMAKHGHGLRLWQGS